MYQVSSQTYSLVVIVLVFWTFSMIVHANQSNCDWFFIAWSKAFGSYDTVP